MIRFLIKGLLRDRHRSLFPVITVTLGVMLTVVVHCWVTGILGDVVDTNARFATGHVKIVSRAYAEMIEQKPLDLALMGVDSLLAQLQVSHPEMQWVKRVQFGGLLDVPDEQGETRAQGPTMALAIDLLSPTTAEVNRLNVASSLVKGRLPQRPGELLLSDEFASKLHVSPGETVTLIGSTMFGSMTMENFSVSGTVRFGVTVMDRGMIIIDIQDAETALDMADAASEILGYFPDGTYHAEPAGEMSAQFNAASSDSSDEFAPLMLSLTEQSDMAQMLEYMSSMVGIFITIFVFAMSIVLWNAGLLGGLRRYGEIGVRLAIGESKPHVYRSMIGESLLIGIAGSILGTFIGLGFAWLLQEKGIDLRSMAQNSTMMAPSTFRAQITPPAYFIGIIPGLISTMLGTMLSGIGIYKRKTATLFKELET